MEESGKGEMRFLGETPAEPFVSVHSTAAVAQLQRQRWIIFRLGVDETGDPTLSSS